MVDKIKSVLYKKNTDLLFLLVIATILRLKDIVRYELWFDEAFTGLLTKLPFDKFLIEVGKDAHPPLYSYANRILTHFISTNDFTMRLIPLICGILIVYYTYKTTEYIFSKQAGVIAGLFIAISPFLIEYSVEARSYNFYGFLTLFSFYSLLKNKYINFYIGISLLVLTHYFSIFYILGLGIIFLYKIYSEKIDILKSKQMLLGAIIPLVSAAYIILKALKRSYTGLNTYWIRSANILNIFDSIKAYLIGVKSKQPGTDILNDIALGSNTHGILNLISVLIILGIIYLIIRQKRWKKS